VESFEGYTKEESLGPWFLVDEREEGGREGGEGIGRRGEGRKDLVGEAEKSWEERRVKQLRASNTTTTTINLGSGLSHEK